MNYKIHNFSFINFTCLTEEKHKEILAWRNDDRIRKWATDTRIINYAEHINFVNNLRNTKENVFWLIQKGDVDFGIGHITRKDEKLYNGFYLKPKYLMTGAGVELEYYMLCLLFNILNYSEIYGIVNKNNINVLKIHEFFKFEIVDLMNLRGKMYLEIKKKKDTWNELNGDFEEFFKNKIKSRWV